MGLLAYFRIWEGPIHVGRQAQAGNRCWPRSLAAHLGVPRSQCFNAFMVCAKYKVSLNKNGNEVRVSKTTMLGII